MHELGLVAPARVRRIVVEVVTADTPAAGASLEIRETPGEGAVALAAPASP